mmetsp:Transcript_69891/g.182073  ORF Transcript_69891/g.182073 Transcript_69891/m.182073 type:complete len:208 (+) Transcript_69891:99-722(+)
MPHGLWFLERCSTSYSCGHRRGALQLLILVDTGDLRRPVISDPPARTPPLVVGDPHLGLRPGPGELAHRRQARYAWSVARVHPDGPLVHPVDALVHLVHGHVLEGEQQRIPLGVVVAVVVHEDREDPDVERRLGVSVGPVPDLDLLAVRRPDDRLRPRDQVLRRWILASLDLRGHQLPAAGALRPRQPAPVVDPVEGSEGLHREHVA